MCIEQADQTDKKAKREEVTNRYASEIFDLFFATEFEKMEMENDDGLFSYESLKRRAVAVHLFQQVADSWTKPKCNSSNSSREGASYWGLHFL